MAMRPCINLLLLVTKDRWGDLAHIGARLPNLTTVLTNPKTQWQKVIVNSWYGGEEREVELVSDTAVWYHTGMPAVPIRWVLVRDPQEKFKPQAFLCTNLTVAPLQFLQWFVQRWQVEVTFEEVRAHLGVETQRQWSDKAIARTTPALLGLFSLVTLLAHHMQPQPQIPVRQSAWYLKPLPTFVDAKSPCATVLMALYTFPYVTAAD